MPRRPAHHIVSYNVTINGGSAMAGYHPMTLADLAGHLSRAADDRTRWKLTWEFLEEYRWESSAVQPSLLRDEPPGTGDERWDALLAALAEHLAAQHDLAPPEWAELRVLQRPCNANSLYCAIDNHTGCSVFLSGTD
jgi:hypothetical protein